MVLFQNMTSVSVCSVFMVTLLVAFGTGSQPFLPAWRFIKSLIVSRKYLLFFIAVSVILLLNKNELRIEQWLDISYDLTAYLSIRLCYDPICFFLSYCFSIGNDCFCFYLYSQAKYENLLCLLHRIIDELFDRCTFLFIRTRQ